MNTAHGETNILTVPKAASALGVSPATVRNWIRLGKLKGLDADSVVALKKSIASGGTALRSRRNKTALSHGEEYAGYIRSQGRYTPLSGGSFSLREIRVILTEAALRLFSDDTALTEAFIDGERFPIPRRLIDDLLCGARPTKKTKPIIDGEWRPDREQDSLGYIYMSLLPLNVRRSRGAYYTPRPAVERTCALVGESASVLDPCCGSGNFLLSLAERFDPLRLRAADTDPVAVALARINLYSRFPELGDGYLYKNIVRQDFFSLDYGADAIVGNPPWGGSPEASGQFVLHALDLLKDGGQLAFLLPQALLTARSHAEVRRRLLDSSRITSADYVGDCFKGVSCPTVILSAVKGGHGTKGCRVNSAFTLNIERGDDFRCLNLNVSDEEYLRLKRMREMKNAVRIGDGAIFGLGIVTGNNSAALVEKGTAGCEGVIRGRDILPGGRIAEPSSFIIFDPSSFQQCAPTELYRSKEKIVYRFIGRRPAFAVDTLGRLTLNSCNFFIPRFKGLSADYIATVLNSEAVGFFLEKSFGATKWLRWHIEEIPVPLVSPERQKEICLSNEPDKLINELYFSS